MHIIFLSSRSVSFELDNTQPYFSSQHFEVLLNQVVIYSMVNRNVCSIYGLNPDTEYEICANGESCHFVTDKESVSLNVYEFNAKGDGITDDTSAIQAAILCCPVNGRVLLPKGVYRIRPLFLKSDISIEIEKDAVLLGETDRNAYPVLPGLIQGHHEDYYFGTWEGRAESAFAGLITGMFVENVKIYGEGTIDGNADKSDWWKDDLVRRIAWRPRGVFLNRCKNVSLQGITCCNTASWNQHAFFSNDIVYVDMRLCNPKENPNTDGINPESCDGVKIIGCYFAVGDDCIAIKSGKIEIGKKLRTPCQNIIVRNCFMDYGHGAITLGSELSAGLSNISVSQCFFKDTDRGIRIKTQRGRGDTAVIDYVLFENIHMQDVLSPLVINMFYKARNDFPDDKYVYSEELQPVDERTPHFGKFLFKNIHAVNAEYAAGYFWGLPESPIEEITLENCFFQMRKSASAGFPVMSLHAEQVCGRGLIFKNVNFVKIQDVVFENVCGATYEFIGVKEKIMEASK